MTDSKQSKPPTPDELRMELPISNSYYTIRVMDAYAQLYAEVEQLRTDVYHIIADDGCQTWKQYEDERIKQIDLMLRKKWSRDGIMENDICDWLRADATKEEEK